MKKILLWIVLWSALSNIWVRAEAVQPKIMNGVEIEIALKKLLSLGSILYIAAHPDDENTAVLTYMADEKLMLAGYLSLTRGAGGQNLIGSEKGPLMGVLRTYELLEARKIDGAEQFFTRAVDFGYSKTAGESLNIWGKEDILGDMVFIIRKFQPDVVLTRFPMKGDLSGHGHHTAATILAVEAFHAAGDASRFPEQLKYVSPWRPKRILWNTWRPYLQDAKPEDKAKLIALDVGGYNRLLGKSYYEIAALSRTMHKSQGFGAVPRRGEWLDYFDLLAGDPAQKDLFDGVDTSWNRLQVPGAEKARKLLEKANREFKVDEPQNILPALLSALAELKSLPDSLWVRRKTGELTEVIRSCAGLWLEANADSYEVMPGQTIKATASVINRSNFPFILKEIAAPGENGENNVINIQQPLLENKVYKQEFSMNIFEKEYTHPFWLKEKPGKGIYRSGNHELRGMAVAPYPFNVKVVLVSGQSSNEDKPTAQRAIKSFSGGPGGRLFKKAPLADEVCFEVPVLYTWRDPVAGEQIRELVVTPPVTVNFMEKVFYFPGGGETGARVIGLILRSGPAAVSGTLALNLPGSWQVEPAVLSFTIGEPFTEKRVSFKVMPPRGDAACDVTVSAVVEGKTYNLSRVTIEYPHIPVVTLHPVAEARLARVDVKRKGDRIAYIMGSGDDIPRYLVQVGFQVDVLSDEDLHNRDFGGYDAVIMGVRAYNTRDILKHVQERLLAYVSLGGRLVVQYNVDRGLKVQQLGPYPFQISHNRVTEEDAAVTLLEPGHPVLCFPNKIGPGDFEGWVQERGLYFADQWDANYTPLLSCHDVGEEPQKGGLLFARYGKGYFIYTGYSFFRQLPEGVPGALKLFVNMISSAVGN